MHDVISGGATAVAQESQPASAWTPAVVVALCALVFTVGSFWYLNARQGRLRVYEPHSFAATVSGAVLLLRFPLVMYNTGPRPIVVQDLQLRFPDEPSSWFPQPWRTSRSELKPHADDGHKLPSAFAIRGLSAEQHFIEFGGPLPGITLKPQDYRVQIEGRLGHRPGWTPLLDFTLRASHILNPDDYLAYSNAPVEMSKEDKAKADEGFRKLAERLAEVTGKTPPPMPPAKRSRWKRLTRWQ